MFRFNKQFSVQKHSPIQFEDLHLEYLQASNKIIAN
jgi:hypothetical protein